MVDKWHHRKVLAISRITLPITLVMTIGTPVLTALMSYQQAMGDTRKEFVQVRLEAEEKFVHQGDFKSSLTELREINQRLANIEGFLRRDRRR